MSKLNPDGSTKKEIEDNSHATAGGLNYNKA
jgi:hypothetical protein